MKRVTIRDVAKKAGVSISIVSFALNNVEGRVSEKVKQKVIDCARELGYVPNSYARQMRNRKSDTIALVYPKQHFEERNSGTIELVAQVCSYASKKKLDVMIKLYDDGDLCCLEDECMSLFQSEKIDGMIIYANVAGKSFLKTLKDKRENFVHITEFKPMEGVNSVYLNNYQMMYDGVRFVREKGYEEIYYMCAKPLRRHERVVGYESAVRDLQVKGKALYYPNAYRQKEDIWNAIHAVVTDPGRKTAVLCWNDIDAINTLELLMRHKIRVPENVGVMGVDDLIIGEHMSPALTTFKQPFDEIARLAVDILGETFEGEDFRWVEVIPKIIDRESV